ncbi:hypothetical protein HOK51_08900 [Candidatus Woesearchaeota archaeon]|jgi:hypothetical protein|nr:hypothetical protein [Candidatus Woesearchaeota archaeon]MBT6519946.1 hypothetical protein [Candidatus Woesearchaeota archaeon]MBT7367853.1 hypothetical protein [Candidatus Woesearchaeota archaeon]
MKKLLIPSFCIITALAGLGSGCNPVKTEESIQKTYPVESIDFYVKKGEQKNVYYHPGGFAPKFNILVKYDGKLNESGDLEVYVGKELVPLKVGASYKLGEHKISKQKIELTVLELIAEGNDSIGVAHFKLSGPMLND